MDPTTTAIAQAIAALGATGILALLFVLWLAGKLHSDHEMQKQASDDQDDREAWEKEMAFRETLRLEAVADRKAADDRVAKLADAVRENNDLTRRALDLNERLVDEFVHPPGARTRRTDRDRTD